jgi:hypothetical protein
MAPERTGGKVIVAGRLRADPTSRRAKKRFLKQFFSLKIAQ